MLTKKIVSGSLTLALTASVAMLSGCPTTGTPDASPSASVDPSASATASASADPSASASESPSASATASASADPSATASASVPPTIDTKPSGDVGTTPDIASRAAFNGKVYDTSGTPVEGFKVNAKSVDPGVNWVGEETQTVNGAYVFRNAPVGARIEITVSKDGWTTRTRTEVLKSNLQGNTQDNTFDFGGANGSIYGVQDEPQVTMVKVNGALVDRSGQASIAGANENSANINAFSITPAGNVMTDAQLEMLRPKYNNSVALSSVNPEDLTVEITFSEAVDKADVQNNFRIFSEFHHTDLNAKNRIRKDGAFEIDERNPSTTWSWSEDGKTATFKTNKGIFTTNEDNEMRFTGTFVRAFDDMTDKSSLKRDPAFQLPGGGQGRGGYFKFSESIYADYFTFSVKKDSEDPKLVSVAATDNAGNADIVTLTFSESMDVINLRSYGVDLDPTKDVDNNLDLNTTDKKVLMTVDNNKATQIGYNANVGANFRAVYSITRLDVDGKFPHALGAGTNSRISATNTPAAGTTANIVVSSARLDSTGKKLTLEFPTTAFERNDRILVRVGNSFSGSTGVNAVNTSADLKDPSGRTFATGNSSTSGNVTINDSQKVVTAGG